MYSTGGRLFESIAPCSGRTNLVPSRYCLIDYGDDVLGMDLPKIVFCIEFFDCLPTVKSSFRCIKNRVLGIERGNGDCILPIECRVIIRSQGTNLLGSFCIDPVILLSEGWRSKADRQSCKGNCKADFHRIKEAAAIRVFLTRSLFGGDIPRRFLRRVSLAKPTSAPLRF